MKTETITGTLATGVGQATGFTQIDWVVAGFRDLLGMEPWPGTVNIQISTDEAREQWERVKGWPGIILPPPRADWCNSRLYHASIAGTIRAGVVLPETDSYPADQIELIAPLPVRDTLALSDGDTVEITITDSAEAIL